MGGNRSSAVMQQRSEPESERWLGLEDLCRVLNARPRGPDFVEWPEEWFSSGADSQDVARCRALFQTRLALKLDDVVHVYLRRQGATDKAMHPNGPRSVDWVGSRDFHLDCEAAGFDGHAVADRMRVVLSDVALAKAFVARLVTKGTDRAIEERRAEVAKMVAAGARSVPEIASALLLSAQVVWNDLFALGLGEGMGDGRRKKKARR